MTNEEALQILKQYLDMDSEVKSEYLEAQRMAIKALEQQPRNNLAETSQDCISREAVKNTLTEEWSKYIPMELDINLSFVLEKISELPSVTPTRPKGRWIEQKDIHKHHYGWFFCSECGAFLMSSDGADYCSCCGAEMEAEA